MFRASMKTNKMISISVDVFERLTIEENASALIEHLIRQHYNLKDQLKSKKSIKMEKELLAEVATRMEMQARMEEMETFLDSGDYNETEYLQGVKDGKWKGTTEYARIKLKQIASTKSN